MSHPALPQGRWPSAWPSLWRPVRDRAVFAGATVVLTALGLAWLGDFGLSWWVALLPLLTLVVPATKPWRVRRRFERAAARNMLTFQDDSAELWVRAGGRTMTAARVRADGSVSYVDHAVRR